MSCETMIGSIVALLDGELPDGERRALEEHLAGCASCRRERALLERTRGLVSAHLRTASVAPSLERVWQQIDAEAGERRNASLGRRDGGVSRDAGRGRTSAGRRALRWAGAAGGMALAAGLAVMLLRPGFEVAPPERATDPAQVAAAPAPRPEPAAAVVAAKPEPKPATRVAQRAPAPAESEQRVARTEPAPVEAEPAPEAVAVAEPDLPRDLLERPDLFLNYTIVRKLDELRHLDAVLADTPAADAPDDGGAG